MKAVIKALKNEIEIREIFIETEKQNLEVDKTTIKTYTEEISELKRALAFIEVLALADDFEDRFGNKELLKVLKSNNHGN